ncbi:MAG TPA: TonB family protein [Candidatus Acidoferrales bacterium]|nr:TonB family protein [Candidatus Acidoferrales bacterium]
MDKQGSQPQDSTGKPLESARSNPVCLELSITIRSLPTENGGLTKPIRIEGRTVIVFDNGAVLRCTENLPVGQTFILSNPSGREVVCLVVGGRNLPTVKGYSEVQFMEPVNDFWGLREVGAAPVAAPKIPEVRREAAQAPPPPAPVSATPKLEVVAKPAKTQTSNTPSLNEIGGLLSSPSVATKQEHKPAAVQPPSERAPLSASAYSQSGNASLGLVANITSSEAEQAEEKKAKQAVTEALSNALSSGPIFDSQANSSSHAVSSSNVFSSRGILAQGQTEPEPGAFGGRMPLVVGVVALALAGIGAGAFIMHRGTDSGPAATTAAVSQPVVAPPSTASNEPATDTIPTEAKEQLPAQNVAVEQAPVGAVPSAIPAVVSNAGLNESRSESKLDQKETRRADSAANSRVQSAPAAPRRPTIANLKMSSPSAPSRTTNDLGTGTAPMTDLVATQPAGAGAAPGLLTASGRTSIQPIAPPGAIAPAPVSAPVPMQAAAPKIVAPKLISSARLTYPASAKQTGIQGTVTLLATVEANGIVSSAKALNGPLLLRQAALDSVKQWKYSPGSTDGRPTAAQVTVAVEFKLN